MVRPQTVQVDEGEAAEVIPKEPAPAQPPKVEAPGGCESCGKDAPKDQLQTVEGFSICQAYMSSDAELAAQPGPRPTSKALTALEGRAGVKVVTVLLLLALTASSTATTDLSSPEHSL